jgi:hypothetical protein
VTLDDFTAFVRRLRELGVTEFGGDHPGYSGQGVHVVLGPLPVAKEPAVEPPAQASLDLTPEQEAQLKALGLTRTELADISLTLEQ